MPPKQHQHIAAPILPQGPTRNHQLNVLRDQLVAQMKAHDTLDTTQDPQLQVALEKDIATRKAAIANTLNDYLYDPFARQPVPDFSDDEVRVLRRLRAALISELEHPSESGKKELIQANKALVLYMRPKEIPAVWETKPWVPEKYRHLPAINSKTNRKFACWAALL